jgi:hypothetical protein
MALYQLTAISIVVLRTSDNVYIYDNPAPITSQDWLDYQTWLAVPNTPDPMPTPPPPTVIPIANFWARFTPAEQSAIETYATTNASIAQAMTFGAVVGMVNLISGPIVTTWMAALVTAGVITSARSTAILTP